MGPGWSPLHQLMTVLERAEDGTWMVPTPSTDDGVGEVAPFMDGGGGVDAGAGQTVVGMGPGLTPIDHAGGSRWNTNLVAGVVILAMIAVIIMIKWLWTKVCK